MIITTISQGEFIDTFKKNEAEALRWLEERTEVIKFDTGIIIRDF